MFDEWLKSGSNQEFKDYWGLTSAEMAQINSRTHVEPKKKGS
jgi:cephalosporin-C deacetylase-like acetyl esterase